MSHRNLDRRKFVRAAAALAAAPFILPSSVWCAETKPADRLTMGFIGLGKQNRSLLADFIRRKETQVVAVCEVDTTRRDHAKKYVEDHYARAKDKAFKGCTAHDDFRELLARADIDAVVIATPDHWHAIIAIAAANAGKDIYCEKPLCHSIHEARAMVNAVRRNQRIFQTGSMQRSSREFRTACELVRNGRIGLVKSVHVGVGGPAVPCDLEEEEPELGLDWKMWLGPAPFRPYNSILSPRGVHEHFPRWRNYREYGGGGVTDWGAHHFDIAQWGLGMDDGGPVEVIPPKDERMTTGVKLTYPGDIEVTHTSDNGVTFNGTGGKVYVNRGKFQFWFGKQQVADAPDKLAAVEKEFLSERKVRLYESNDHKGDFLASVRTRKPPIADVEVGARTVSVCHLVNLAYYHHERMTWDAAKEQFVDGAGDSKWLDVPYRDPWKLG